MNLPTQRRVRLQTYYFKNIGLSIELQRSRSENGLNALKEAFDHNVLTSGRYLRNPSATRCELRRGHGQAI
jgi:hypothetical protein